LIEQRANLRQKRNAIRLDQHAQKVAAVAGDAIARDG
jgi:hypothetical protein